MSDPNHRTELELLAGLPRILESPKDGGTVALIVCRPKCNQRRLLAEAELSPDEGLCGDKWAATTNHRLDDGRPDPRLQIALMNSRCLELVAGSEELIETLIQFARPYIYTTSQPPAVACATLKSLQLLRKEGWRRQHLRNLIVRFRRGAQELGLTLMDSPTPIQPLLVGDSGRAMRLSARLRERGLLVGAIRPPTVPQGTSRLRISITAAHDDSALEALGAALRQSRNSRPNQ